ncbi:DUF1217 domain-containing protein [Paracoccus luteus]|uniref:DUF1217 domain-containing protein n=1 Tax=Paracoccus luteus TaxID=2508543 RepID=UPI0010704C26|nr:DUF1217 domain-containing protein [Paracoccus luteus]
MSFQPFVGTGGYAGWRLLNRTADQQKAMIARDPAVAQAGRHYRETIGTVQSAEQLVGDFRLLKTTLTAFGLENDLNSRFFIRKVLESDLDDPKSLVNRLSDKRYRALAEVFRFDGSTPKTTTAGFADAIIARHVDAELERRVGTVDGNLRLAMNARRELPPLAASGSTDATKWYTILGSTPLRKVVEGAFNLGSSFAKLPLDRQLLELQGRSERLLGSASPGVLADPAKVEKLIQRFLLTAGNVTPSQSSYSAALTLLTS